ncbi:hypothetical protein OMP38_16470 [Cohnella ginsengisoli]|uniref:Uncharacterized protein n=1 Tax=Cohnella ginsengisoli TaxID=425004 RepID=A0A9X4KMH4_9BACL|nr:hypothetical protein [Cohnella ginsengisoli]MDG0792285.1 hypothetical protein [Cohnella ginsengisoli]
MKLEHYLDALKRQAAEKRAARGLPVTDESRGRLVAAFDRLLGEFPEAGDDPEPQLLERVACVGYTRELVEIGTVEGLRMRVYVLIPTGGGFRNDGASGGRRPARPRLRRARDRRPEAGRERAGGGGRAAQGLRRVAGPARIRRDRAGAGRIRRPQAG